MQRQRVVASAIWFLECTGAVRALRIEAIKEMHPGVGAACRCENWPTGCGIVELLSVADYLEAAQRATSAQKDLHATAWNVESRRLGGRYDRYLLESAITE